MRTAEENKALIEKYPILLPRNSFTGKVVDGYDYSYTCLDQMPAGWAKAFGIPLFEDIQNEVNTWKKEARDDFFFTDIKEKFGELRIYTSSMSEKLFEILEAYCTISRNVCIVCGKLDVPMVNRGWMSPYCRDCAVKADLDSVEEYEDAVKDEPKEIATLLKFGVFMDGKNYTEEIDITKYVNKVRDYNKE
jgi:hypothetical protein